MYPRARNELKRHTTAAFATVLLSLCLCFTHVLPALTRLRCYVYRLLGVSCVVSRTSSEASLCHRLLALAAGWLCGTFGAGYGAATPKVGRDATHRAARRWF